MSGESQYTARLRAMAEPLMKAAKNDLAKTGRVSPGVVFESPLGLHAGFDLGDRMAELLNDGHGKDILFGGLRKMVRDLECTGVAILTDAWFRKSTEAGMRMEHGQFLELLDEIGHDGMEKRGLMVSVEAIMVNAQVPERALILSQPYTRGPGKTIKFGEPEQMMEMPMEQFEGRQKMFGDVSEEKLHLHRNSKMGKAEAEAEAKKKAT